MRRGTRAPPTVGFTGCHLLFSSSRGRPWSSGDGLFQPNRRGSAQKRGRARPVRPISGLYSFDFSGLFPCAYQTAELGFREYEIRFRASIQTSKRSVVDFHHQIYNITSKISMSCTQHQNALIRVISWLTNIDRFLRIFILL